MFSFKRFSKLEYHKTLNPKVWDGDTLKPDIKEHLLKIAAVWLEHAKLPQEAVIDYVLCGGNANYNYTPFSDLDVHILVDPDKLPIKDTELMHDIIMDKKNSWAAKHNITVAGYPVELYAQMTSEHMPDGQGAYSMSKDTWLQHPSYLAIKYNSKSLHDLVQGYKDAIESVLAAGDVKAAEALKDQITGSRSIGLARGGEFDELPTAFKAVRNSGYLQKLSDFITKSQDMSLSY